MERVFDDLIYAIHHPQDRGWRAAAATWALHLAGNLTSGIAIGVGIAVGIALAG